MKPLSKGDTCCVRLRTGEVVEATYVKPSIAVKKDHFVFVGGEQYRATSKPQEFYSIPECRFVGPACALVPVGVSV